MDVKGLIGLTLAAVVALSTGGCMFGSGVELGVFGSTLDSDDLGDGRGGGVKLEANLVDVVSVDARASWLQFTDTDIDMFPLEVAGLLNFPMFWEHIVPYVGVGAGYYLFDGDGVIVVPRKMAIQVARYAHQELANDKAGRRKLYEALGMELDETVL